MLYNNSQTTMDFLDPAKKRAHAIRLMIGYALLAMAIALVSLILLFQSYGYDLDRHTGAIIQNGLVLVGARPESANIFINGQSKGNTDGRFALPAGQYTFELKREGYRDWKRTFTLEGGKLERLTYPTLFPKELKPKDVQLYGSSPSFSTNSPDRQWILIGQPQAFGKFDVFDANQTSPNPTVISLPDGVLSKSTGPEALSLVEWSTDNRHVLLKHTFSGGFEFVMVDRENPAESLNVNKQLGQNPAQIGLRDKKFDQLYIYSDTSHALQTANLKTKQIQPYLNGVLSFKSYGANTMFYVGDDGTTPGRVQVKLLDDKTTYRLRTLPPGTSYVLDLARYNNSWFMAVGAKSEGIISIYKDPQSAPKLQTGEPVAALSVLRLDQPAFMSFSASTQFIAVQSGPKFAIYDAESNKRYYYELPFGVASDYQMKWMDSSHLVGVTDNKTVVFDYDGINLQYLAPSAPSLEPFFDRDYTTLYNTAPAVTVPGRAALTRTSLKAEQ